MNGAGREPFVRLEGVSKAFGPVQALQDVRIELIPGEVHCLAGENGAGKSTLIKILTGAQRRDTGTYEIGGRDAGHPSPAQARTAGVGVVYQELSLLPDLSVAENLLMGRLPARRGITRPRELRRQARDMLDRVDLGHLDPDTPVVGLSLAVRQLVEIAKVLGQNPRLVIFDEPTTALSEAETAALLRRIKLLRDEGHAIMYVSHHLEEMFDIGDRVTILRDGKFAATGPMRDYDHDSLIAAMVGRKIESLYPAGSRTIGAPRLVVRGLRPVGLAADVSGGIDFTVHSGEILGVAGLLGSGRTELLRAIFGADPVAAGSVELDGVRVPPGNPRAAVRAGLGLLTEDRKQLGLMLELAIRENASIAQLPQIAKFFLVDKRQERDTVDRYLGGLRLRAGSWEQPVSSLSGGNQQKVLLARWLATHAKVLLFDEPTKGVDVGAKSEIYQVIGDLAADGLGVIVVSSYLPEVLGLADRVLVMREGLVVGELPAAGATEEDVLHLASGTTKADAVAASADGPARQAGGSPAVGRDLDDPAHGPVHSAGDPAQRAGDTPALGRDTDNAAPGRDTGSTAPGGDTDNAAPGRDTDNAEGEPR